jgi:hypothetical protein
MPTAPPEALKKKARPSEAKPQKEEEPKETRIQFGLPIETDRIKVECEGLKVIYTIKSTGERLVKEYANEHALMIIHGRISHDPHGRYTQQCVAKARIAMMKLLPLG